MFPISDHPNVTSLTPNGAIAKNQSTFAVFVCTVTGFPTPPVRWMKHDSSNPSRSEEVLEQDDKIIVKESTTINGLVTVESTLIILNLSIADSKIYTCIGENPLNITNHLEAISNTSVSLTVQCKQLHIKSNNTPCYFY